MPSRQDVEVFQPWSASKCCSLAVKEIVIHVIFIDFALLLTEYASFLCQWLKDQTYFGDAGWLNGLDECDNALAEMLHYLPRHRLGSQRECRNR